MATVDITSAMIAYLKSLSAVTALTGTGSVARIYPDDLKQGIRETACTVSRIGGGPVGYMGGRSGLNHATFQIVAYGSTRATADQLDNAIFDTLGSAGNVTMGSVKVTEVNAVDNSRDSGDDLPVDGSDARRYWARTSYKLFYFDS